MPSLKSLVPLLFLAGSGLLHAQSKDWETSFKFQVTPTLSEDDQHSNSGWALGFEVARGVGRGQVFAGLKYWYFRAYEYEATQTGTGYVLDGSGTGIITRYVLDSSGNPVTNINLDSADYRKNSLEGFEFTLGYRVPVWARLNLSAHGGISFSALQSKQVLNSAIRVVDPAIRNATTVSSTATALSSEEIFDTVQKSKTRPGFFTGLRSQVTRDLYVETNLAWVGYGLANYVPYSYTGQKAHVDVVNRTKFLFEMCAGIKF